MAQTLQNHVSFRFSHWLKAKLTDPNLYCVLTGVVALVVIETVIF
ncbi:hypothetical protein [Alteromonas confluentis]|nr:hypothetical protein [Alteromonas confluentis]